MYFKKNIEALRLINPDLSVRIESINKKDDLQILTSKKGPPSLRIHDITLHSLYDPIKEAEGWVEQNRDKFKDASSVVVFGFGLGYHIIELTKATDRDLIIYEPGTDILRAAFGLVDFTPILSRLRIITGNEISEIDKGYSILEHKPSVNLNPQYFEGIRLKLKVQQKMKRWLKIMVVSPIYGGSFPVAKFCASALQNLGHKVDFVDNSIYKDALLSINSITSSKAHQNQLREMFTNFVSETIIGRCNEFKPDIILALAQAPLSISSLQKLKANRIPTAFWFVEDFRLMPYWQDIAPLYDYFFTIQRGELFNGLRDKGVMNYSYLPLAASPDVHKEIKLTEDELKSYGSDISFTGAGYRNRRRFFEGLIDLDFKIWGNEWDLNLPIRRCIQRSGERIETEEIVKIFNATRININLHSSTYHDGINPYGDFVNPRTFEIAACGSFQLIDYRSELPELFEIGKEIICFRDINDLRHQIRYYLDNPDEREKVALSGKERILRGHTYEHRMKEMLEFIFEKGYDPPAWKRDTQDVEILKEGAKGNRELEEYLDRFVDRESIGLKDIVADMQTQGGNLSGVEKIFLLMNALENDHRIRD